MTVPDDGLGGDLDTGLGPDNPDDNDDTDDDENATGSEAGANEGGDLTSAEGEASPGGEA